MCHRQAAVVVGGVMSEQPTDCQLWLRVRIKKYTCVKEKKKEGEETKQERKRKMAANTHVQMALVCEDLH